MKHWEESLWIHDLQIDHRKTNVTTVIRWFQLNLHSIEVTNLKIGETLVTVSVNQTFRKAYPDCVGNSGYE
jgi:hypothetical protein